MVEFVMEGRDHAARAESEFVFGFIEAMFFTSCSPAYDSEEWFTPECRHAQEEGQADGELPGDVGYTDIHQDSLVAIRAFCASFETLAAPLLEQAYKRDYDAAQAGRDLWYTSQGHGVGYWDRKELDAGNLGDKLSDVARYHEAQVWFEDAPFVYFEATPYQAMESAA